MSQPSPIGSVEFIVKFDTMQGGFVDALKKALKDVDLGGVSVDPKLTSKIDEILFNLRNRLRGIWTGDRLQFLETAKPELEHIRSKQVMEQVGTMARNKNIVEQLSGESEKAWIQRSEETARDMLDNWALMVEKAVKNQDYFEKNKRRLITYQGAMESGLGLGNWERLSRDMFKQILKEFKMEKAFKKMAEEVGFGIITQKAMAPVPITIDERGKGKDEKFIEDFGQLTDALAKKGVDPLELQKAMDISPTNFKDLTLEFRTAVEGLLEDYIIPEASKIPNVILHIWREFLGESAEDFPIRGGIRPDLEFIIQNTKESVEAARRVFEKGGMPEQKIEEIFDEAREAFGLEEGEEFGTKVEGVEVEVTLVEDPEVVDARETIKKLDIMRSKIAGLSEGDIEKIEKEQEDLKIIIETFEETQEISEENEMIQQFKVFTADFKNFASEAVEKDIGARYSAGARIFDVQALPHLIKIAQELFMGEEELPETVRIQKEETIKKMLSQIISLVGGIPDDISEQWATFIKAAEDAGIPLDKIFKGK
jgi:hypothetical protein